MSEEDLENHGNATLNETGATPMGTLVAVCAMQQSAARAVFELQLTFAHEMSRLAFRSVFR